MRKTNLRDGLLRHSVLLFAAQQIGNVANMGFQMVCGRYLTGVEYSIMVALLNSVMICSVPVQALRTLLVYSTAQSAHAGRYGDVGTLVKRWSGYLAGVSVLVVGAVALSQGGVLAFLNMDRPEPLWAMVAILVLTLFLTLQGGVLHGLQSFRWLVVCTTSFSMVRVACAALFLLVLLQRTATWALSAQVIGCSVFIGLAAVAIHRALRTEEPTDPAASNAAPYFLQSLLLLGAYTVLMNMDMILVRRWLPDEAGLFAQAATIGRTVIFLPMPIAMALFPKVTSEGTMSKADVALLVRGMAYASVLILAAAGVCLAVPWLPALVLFGRDKVSPELLPLIRGVVLALSPLSLGFMLMNFEMAQRRFRVVPGAVVLALVYVGGVALFHDSVWQVIGILGGASLGFLLLHVLVIRFDLSVRANEA